MAKRDLTAIMRGFGSDKAAGLQGMVDRGELQWRPDMVIDEAKILPPIGSGHNPAAVMDWAKGRADTAKDMYAGAAAAPKQNALSEALREVDSAPSHIAWQSSNEIHGGK